MALRPVPSDDDWPLEIAEAAQAEMWCTIEVFIPGSIGTYDPSTGTYSGGTPDTILLTERSARAQHLRSPLESFGAYERSVKRAYRFQVVPLDTDPVVTDAARIRVKSVKRSRSARIMKYIFSVTSTAFNDHDALLTIEAESELGDAS